MHHEEPSDSSRKTHSHRNAYIATVASASVVLLGISASVMPHAAGAYWPFASADAATTDPTPVLQNSTLALLQAAVNPDPNPLKGGPDISSSEGAALMPAAGPDGSLPAAGHPTNDTQLSTAGNGSISVYVVQPGDNLSQIAADHGITLNTILWANNIKDPSTIKPGTSLVILPVSGIQHTVQSGETLAGIAAKFHADANDIASINGLAADAPLQTGSELIIPGGELSASSVSSNPSGSKKSSSSSASRSSGSIKQGGSLANVHANPYRGGSGAPLPGYFGNPLPGGIITQGIHGWNGIDIGAPKGTPIYAAAAGTVIVARDNGAWNGGYGNYVVISHANGTQTLYAHFSSIDVSVGQSVARGQKLGGVGMTGDATGNHLHFEVRGAQNPFAHCSVGAPCSPE